MTVGMAAPQVGIDQRFFIMPSTLDYLKHGKSPTTMRALLRSFEVFINPQIITKST